MSRYCEARGCDRPVADAYVCSLCIKALELDLRRIISGHQADIVVVEMDKDKFSIIEPTRQPVVRGSRQGKPIISLELAPGSYARQLSSPFDHAAGLLADLDATFDREARAGNSTGGRSNDDRIIWHERAGEQRRRITRTLARYARLVADARGISLPDDAEPITLADWLLRHIDWLRHQEIGGTAVSDVGRLVDDTMRIIDRAADRWYAGPCTSEPEDNPGGYCSEDLYAKPDSPTVICRRCDSTYDVNERRIWLLTAAEDQLAHAELIGRAAANLGVDITPAAIRGYARYNRIAEKGRDRLRRPLYRVGDVLRVATEAAAARERRQQKAG